MKLLWELTQEAIHDAVEEFFRPVTCVWKWLRKSNTTSQPTKEE